MLRDALVSHPADGSLPALLLVLTVVTGVVDAVSILSLGRVFVANMTGNVVFVGFALTGAPGFSLSASLFALAGFLVGAFAAGVEISRVSRERNVLLRDTVLFELALVLGATALAAAVSTPFGSYSKDAIAALVAVAMGMQNAMARRLAVADLTTTVLTMTLTGIAADIRARNTPVLLRRFLAVATMLAGAVCGALLVIHSRPVAALALASGLLAFVAFFAYAAARSARLKPPAS